jgi:hypothetical protein
VTRSTSWTGNVRNFSQRFPLGTWGSLTCSKSTKVPSVRWIFPSWKIRGPPSGLNPRHSGHEVGTLPLDHGGRLPNYTEQEGNYCRSEFVAPNNWFIRRHKPDGDIRKGFFFYLILKLATSGSMKGETRASKYLVLIPSLPYVNAIQLLWACLKCHDHFFSIPEPFIIHNFSSSSRLSIQKHQIWILARNQFYW